MVRNEIHVSQCTNYYILAYRNFLGVEYIMVEVESLVAGTQRVDTNIY